MRASPRRLARSLRSPRGPCKVCEKMTLAPLKPRRLSKPTAKGGSQLDRGKAEFRKWLSLGPAKCRKTSPQLARSEKEGILKTTSTRSATLWVGRAGEPNIGIRLSKFVQFLSFFIKRSLLHRDTNFAQPVDSPFCLRMPVQRTIILRPDVQRGCRLGSNFLKADS